MGTRRPIESEEGWEIVQKGITKVINMFEGVPEESPIDADYWINLYTAVYTMSNRLPSPGYSKELYEMYQSVINDYSSSTAVPAIQEKQNDDVSMLQELVKRWANHKVMVRKLCQIFGYLDRYYIPRRKLPALKDVGFGCFREIVYEKMKAKVRDAVIAMINREREGDEINRGLVKDVL